MTVRIKTKWRTQGPRSPEQRASVVAAGIWRIAQGAFKHMGEEEYTFSSEDQVTRFITEFVAFLVQITDRMLYGRMSESNRQIFMNAVGSHLARVMDTSQMELRRRPGDYAAQFIEALNARAVGYAEFEYTSTGPGYSFLRHLSERIAEIMTGADNKWVFEQVADIEAPAAIRAVRKLVTEVTGVKSE